MYFKKTAGTGEVIKALVTLEPGNADDFVIAEIGGKVYDSIQAIKNPDKTYHVELLRKGGNPEVFNGNQIFALESIPQESAVKIFMAMMQKRDKLPMPKGAKNITTAAASNRIQ